MNEKSVNKESLMERVDYDLELLAELVEIYEEDTAENIESIKAAIGSQDAGQLEKSAHSLKGSSSNMSAELVVEFASKLEQAGRNGDFEETDDILSSLNEEFNRVVSALKAILAENI